MRAAIFSMQQKLQGRKASWAKKHCWNISGRLRHTKAFRLMTSTIELLVFISSTRHIVYRDLENEYLSWTTWLIDLPHVAGLHERYF